MKGPWRVESKRGGVIVAYYWVQDEPSLVIYRKGSAAYVLPLSSAHELVHPGGERIDTVELWEKAQRAARVLGGGPRLAMYIADAMIDSLDALCDMPPAPEERPEGEVTVKVDGETIFEA